MSRDPPTSSSDGVGSGLVSTLECSHRLWRCRNGSGNLATVPLYVSLNAGQHLLCQLLLGVVVKLRKDVHSPQVGATKLQRAFQARGAMAEYAHAGSWPALSLRNVHLLVTQEAIGCVSAHECPHHRHVLNNPCCSVEKPVAWEFAKGETATEHTLLETLELRRHLKPEDGVDKDQELAGLHEFLEVPYLWWHTLRRVTACQGRPQLFCAPDAPLRRALQVNALHLHTGIAEAVLPRLREGPAHGGGPRRVAEDDERGGVVAGAVVHELSPAGGLQGESPQRGVAEWPGPWNRKRGINNGQSCDALRCLHQGRGAIQETSAEGWHRTVASRGRGWGRWRS
mmetsp:Transcript_24758/g.71251  ORF Transcript_24758/g.71251 Transcript_24758/m.71251 type:complete len:340 (-) Transcript_24758:19-1038(-)